MEVFVSIDMEGVAGIAHIRQVMRGTDDYPAARQLMTREANAAVAGAFAGGATRVVVNDSHGDMTNLLPDRMDPRAELTIGSPKVPFSMMTGIDARFGVALFLGYHAGAGTEAAVLDHTYYGRILWDVRLNGESQTEASLNAADDGLAGIQQLAGDATLLYYLSEEAQEGRNAYVEKRKPEFDRYPRRP